MGGTLSRALRSVLLAAALGGCTSSATIIESRGANTVQTGRIGALNGGPELYGEGVFSTGAWDFFVALERDHLTAYLCRASADFTHFTILRTHLEDGRWSTPEVAPFSGRWSDADPHLSPDGTRMYFISNRPIAGGDEKRGDYDIWYVERTALTAPWSEPTRLPAPVNSDSSTEWSPSVAANGNLYFGAIRPGGKGNNDLYVARWENGAYARPESVGDSINTRADEVEPWVAPDESYLIFSGRGRPDGIGGFDLYISRRRDNEWGTPQLLGNGVNSPAGDFNQSVSPDGRYLYFSSTRGSFERAPSQPLTYAELERRLGNPGNGLGDIYRVEMARIGIGAR